MISVISCQKNDKIEIDPIDLNKSLLIGSWVNPKYSEESTAYERADKLQENAPGVLFKENGLIIKRTSGWCGTPPLIFFDVEGTWSIENDIVKITTQEYNGSYQWRILSLTEKELVVKRELTAQEKDHRELMELFDEIQTIAYSVSCKEANDWSFTAYGSKACGGPQGYIAYSNKIDTVAFLEKLVIYTQAEDVYNKKWGIISTCDIAQQPTAVICENGYPMLKY